MLFGDFSGSRLLEFGLCRLEPEVAHPVGNAGLHSLQSAISLRHFSSHVSGSALGQSTNLAVIVDRCLDLVTPFMCAILDFQVQKSQSHIQVADIDLLDIILNFKTTVLSLSYLNQD